MVYHAQTEIEYASRVGKKVVILAETDCFEPGTRNFQELSLLTLFIKDTLLTAKKPLLIWNLNLLKFVMLSKATLPSMELVRFDIPLKCPQLKLFRYSPYSYLGLKDPCLLYP